MLTPVLVNFAVTRRCNLRCIHCYSEAVREPHPKELTTEEAKDLIIDVAKTGVKMLIFDGGEPTLREDLPELVKIAYDNGLIPLLGTNGADDVLTKTLLRKLREAGIKAIAISLDGVNPKTHDEFRGVEGVWEKTLKGINNAREVGVPFQINIAVHRKNFNELPALIDLAKKLGAIAVEIFDFVAVGRGREHVDYELLDEERIKLVRYIIKRQFEEEIPIRIIAVPQYWIEALKETENKREYLSRFTQTCCAAGRRYATILYDGTVYPCMLLPIPLGNIRDKRFSEIWRESEILNKLRDPRFLRGRCRDCKYNNICIGARCKAFAKTRDIFAEDPTCWFAKNREKNTT